MTCIWSGELCNLKDLILEDKLLRELHLGYSRSYGDPSPAEVSSWEGSLPSLVDILIDPKYDRIQVLIELAMPVGAERADVVLLGGTSESPAAYIIPVSGSR